MNNRDVNLRPYIFFNYSKQKRKKEIICEIFGTGKSMIPNPVMYHTLEKCESFVMRDLTKQTKVAELVSLESKLAAQATSRFEFLE